LNRAAPGTTIHPSSRASLFVGRKIYHLGPVVGLLANDEGGIFGYGGVYADVRLGSSGWRLTPEVRIGGNGGTARAGMTADTTPRA
jgi:hypothetical protein